MNDGLNLTGHITAVLRGPDGAVKQVQEVENTITTAGKAAFVDQMLASPGVNKITHMAVGTGTPGATALGTELDRNALTSKTRSGAVLTMVGDWAAGDGTGTLTEAGLFDAASSGNMIASGTIAVTKGASDTLSLTWTITAS
jgi:hypothetical protein